MAAADGVTGGQAANEAVVRAAHARLLTDHSIQFQPYALVPPKPPWWLVPLGRFLKFIGPVLVPTFWTIVIAGALIIVALIANELGFLPHLPQRRTMAPADDDAAWRPAEAAARALLADADALAAAGRHGEAVHILLRRSIADIGSRIPRFLSPSLTSRDIAGSPRLPAAPRQAFATIAALVERAVFARRALDADDWVAARAAYTDFLTRAGWA